MLLVAKNIISDSNLFFYLYNFSQSTTFEYNSEKADKGSTDDVVNSITNVINSRTPSKGERRNHFKNAKKVFEVDKCKTK